MKKEFEVVTFDGNKAGRTFVNCLTEVMSVVNASGARFYRVYQHSGIRKMKEKKK